MKTNMVALAVVAVLGTTACASAGGQVAMNTPEPHSNTPVQVKVRNNNEDNVNVYALVDGTYRRVAAVPAMETREVELPAGANVAHGVRLLVDPVGSSNAFFTNRIIVSPGQMIDLRVANTLRGSTWSVD